MNRIQTIVLALALCASEQTFAACTMADVDWLLSLGHTVAEARAKCAQEAAAQPLQAPVVPQEATSKTATDPKVQSSFNAGQASQDWTGDKMSFEANVSGEVIGADGKTKTVCLPDGAPLRGLSKETENGVSVKLRITGDAEDTDELKKYQAKNCLPKGDVDLPQVVGQAINIKKTDVDSIPIQREGWTYGALVVPYKYHLGGAKDLSGTTSVGPYIGGQWSAYGWNFKTIGFSGLSSVPQTQTTNGTTTTNNLTAITYGFGFLGSVKDGFQAGLIFGWDRTGGSSTYADNGKPWAALGIGYSFSN